MWDLAQRLDGQLRTAGQSVIGWDMGAALALAAALGVDAAAAAELLPEIEREMVAKRNELIQGSPVLGREGGGTADGQ